MNITSFSRAHRFLSNFYPSPIQFGGARYPTVEHLYQACKAASAEDREKIRLESGPARAKLLGQRVAMRPDWEGTKDYVMLGCLELKFARGSLLAGYLLGTGTGHLLEGNLWHDNYWGDCHCHKCVGIPGLNRLGEALMRVRAGLY